METFLEINLIFLWIVALLNLFLTFILVLKINTRPSDTIDGLKNGETAPDFVSQDLYGEEVNLTSYSGQKVAFLFVAPRCNACHDLLLKLKTVKTSKFDAMGVNIVLVTDATLEEAKVWAESKKIQLPILVAPRASSSFFKDYNIQGTPSYCLVDENGKVESSGYPSLEKGLWKEITASAKSDSRKTYAI